MLKLDLRKTITKKTVKADQTREKQIKEAKKIAGIETDQKIKKSVKKIEAKEKKITTNIEKKEVKKKPLTNKKKVIVLS